MKIGQLTRFGLTSVSVRIVEPGVWEARVSNSQNGDATARRADPDEALRDAMARFATYKKPRSEDDGLDLI